MSIADSFQKLIEWTEPTIAIIDSGNRHVSGIQSCLGQLDLVNVRQLGSHSRGTPVHRFSDIDLFAVFRKAEVTWGDRLVNSGTILRKVKDALSNTYPNSEMGRDGQAVVVKFQDINVDVVPAFFNGINKYKQPNYWIPDGDDSWMLTSPDAHNSYISNIHEKTGYKFCYATRFIKYWRECRNPRIPLSSFHLELLFASEKVFEGVKSYATCVRDAFYVLAKRECRALQDPLGISGLVSATKTSAQLKQCQDAILTAYERANKAIEREVNRDQEEARRFWDLVFNDHFPSR